MAEIMMSKNNLRSMNFVRQKFERCKDIMLTAKHSKIK